MEGRQVQRDPVLTELHAQLGLLDRIIGGAGIGQPALRRVDHRAESQAIGIGARTPAIAGESGEGFGNAEIDARRIGQIAIVVIDEGGRIIGRHADAPFGRTDRAVAVQVEGDLPDPSLAQLDTIQRTARRAAIIAQAGADRQATGAEIGRGEGRIDRVAQARRPPLRPRQRVIGIDAVLRPRDAGAVEDIEQRRIAAAPDFRHRDRVHRRRVDRLARRIPAGGRRQAAARDLPDAAGANIVGDIADVLLVAIPDREHADQAVAVQRARVGDRLPRIGAIGVAERAAGRPQPGQRGGGRQDLAARRADQPARAAGDAEPFGDRPVGQAELAFQPERLLLHPLAVAHILQHRAIVAVHDQQRLEPAGQQRVAGRIEIGDGGQCGLFVGARHAERHCLVKGRTVVEIFAVEADIAAGELARDIGLDLAALLPVEAGATRTFALAIEAADMEAQIARQPPAIIEVGAILIEIESGGQRDRAAFLLAGLRDEVDDAAGRIGREGRGRTAPYRLHLRQVQVDAHEAVRAGAQYVAELHDRQAVFLQLDELGARRGQRQAADGDVGDALAIGRFGEDAGNVAQQFADRTRCQPGDLRLTQRTRRCRAVQPVAALGDAGGHHILFSRLGVFRRGLCLSGHGDRRRGGQ